MQILFHFSMFIPPDIIGHKNSGDICRRCSPSISPAFYAGLVCPFSGFYAGF